MTTVGVSPTVRVCSIFLFAGVFLWTAWRSMDSSASPSLSINRSQVSCTVRILSRTGWRSRFPSPSSPDWWSADALRPRRGKRPEAGRGRRKANSTASCSRSSRSIVSNATRPRSRRAASIWSSFSTLQHVRQDLKVWQNVIEQLEAGEMPLKGKPQPTPDERKQLIAWIHTFLDNEARARSGDPGRVPLRRLSNAEYDCTIRDLTGVDLRPTARVPGRRSRRRRLHQRCRVAVGHHARPVHQVPERGQGHRRARRAAAGWFPLLARQDAPRLER